MNEQEREAFEALAGQLSTLTLERDEAGRYVSAVQEMLWESFQVRRAALAAKVPAGWHLSGYLYDFNDDSGVAIPDWFTSRADEANRQGHFNVRECYTRATPAPAPEASIARLVLRDDGKADLEWRSAAPAPEAKPCTYPACQTNGCREACEAPAQAQQSSEPLPCPFCGHVGLDFADGSTHRWGLASCAGCGATCGETRRAYPLDDKWHASAIKDWNTRAKPEAQPLTDERIDAETLAQWGQCSMMAPESRIKWSRLLARAVEKACAEAWGVKLGAIGEAS